MRTAYNPYNAIPHHWKRPPVKLGHASLVDELISTLGYGAKILVEAPEFDPFIYGATSGAMRTLREMRMIESVPGPCRHRLTPLGRAMRRHIEGNVQ